MKPQAAITSEVRAEQAAGKKYQIIKLGLDIHADWIVVVRIIENSAPQPAQRFKPADFVRWVKTQVEQAHAVHSCYEAGCFGFVLHRQLLRLGVENLVVQPGRLDEYGRGVNDDKRDARELALRLDRYVAGNPKALATVRVPIPEQEQRRAQSRQRQQLQRELLRVAAEGRSLLLSQGFREKRGWWEGGRWLVLRTHLPAWLVEGLERFRRILIVLSEERDALEAQIVAAAPARRPKGLGALSYELIEREVQDGGRFANRRQVGSYTGLCGGVSASGPSVQLLSITKHGNRLLRTVLIELAWRMLCWQPQSRLIQRWRPVLANPKATRAARKKAIVGVARQVAVDLWRWRTGRVRPEELGWVMIGAA